MAFPLPILYPLSPLAIAEKSIECVKLVNHELDLRDFYKLLQEIDQVNRSKLTQWKNKFTTQFLAQLKAAVKKQKASSEEFYLAVMTVANFYAFAELHDNWRALIKATNTTADVRKFLVAFFEFVSEQKWILSVAEDEVKVELTTLITEKLRFTKESFMKSSQSLIRTGVEYRDLVSYMKDSFRIDPNPTFRRKTALLEEKSTSSDDVIPAFSSLQAETFSCQFLAELGQIAAYDDGWFREAIGDENQPAGDKFSQVTISALQRFVLALKQQSISEPRLSPMNDGSIILEWPGTNVLTQIYSDGHLVFADTKENSGKTWKSDELISAINHVVPYLRPE